MKRFYRLEVNLVRSLRNCDSFQPIPNCGVLYLPVHILDLAVYHDGGRQFHIRLFYFWRDRPIIFEGLTKQFQVPGDPGAPTTK